MSHFSNSPAGPYAAQALNGLDPQYLRQLTRGAGGGGRGTPGAPGAPGFGGMGNSVGMGRGLSSYGGGGGGGSTAGLPDSCTVYFKTGGGDHPILMIPVSINGGRLRCVLTQAHMAYQ